MRAPASFATFATSPITFILLKRLLLQVTFAHAAVSMRLRAEHAFDVPRQQKDAEVLPSSLRLFSHNRVNALMFIMCLVVGFRNRVYRAAFCFMNRSDFLLEASAVFVPDSLDSIARWLRHFLWLSTSRLIAVLHYPKRYMIKVSEL